ncbi:hypothetical protein KM043_009122 [Ampulex compressa]|nr:hypothetical protein KM043_009122 [Ampulex compressa]
MWRGRNWPWHVRDGQGRRETEEMVRIAGPERLRQVSLGQPLVDREYFPRYDRGLDSGFGALYVYLHPESLFGSNKQFLAAMTSRGDKSKLGTRRKGNVTSESQREILERQFAKTGRRVAVKSGATWRSRDDKSFPSSAGRG